MFYGITSKAKSQIGNYASKHIAKQKMSMVNKTTLMTEKENKSLVNTFRKNIAERAKYKTSKNSRILFLKIYHSG